jgi:hypothetical protein
MIATIAPPLSLLGSTAPDTTPPVLALADMSSAILIASALAGINVLLLAALTFVWARNYRTFRTPLILGLLAFGAAMFVENGVALYFFFSTRKLYAMNPSVQQVVAVLRALQSLALVFLTYVTMK